jgi:cytochrome c oxidase assembly protein subunit 15
MRYVRSNLVHSRQDDMTWLHRFAKLLAAATFLLVLAGGLVTTTGSGLAVRDWPSYGFALFTVPASTWAGGFLYQNGHRLVATAVGLLTAVLVGLMRRVERRRWVRRLGMAAFVAIVAQGALGGISVMMALPPAVSIAHAALALLFFGATVALGVVTSAGWLRAYRPIRSAPPTDAQPDHDLVSANAVASDLVLRRLAVATVIVVYLQILLSAVVRHLNAGLAIPDYPLAFGRLIPPLEMLASAPVAAHFAHRVWALVTIVMVSLTAWRISTRHRTRLELLYPAAISAGLVLLQISLGGLVVVTGRNLWIDTAHLAAGALLFAATDVVALRACRALFSGDAAWLAERERKRVPAMAHPSSASAMSAASLDGGSSRG